MEPRRDRTDTFFRGLIAGAIVGAVIAGSSAWGRYRQGRPTTGGADGTDSTADRRALDTESGDPSGQSPRADGSRA